MNQPRREDGLHAARRLTLACTLLPALLAAGKAQALEFSLDSLGLTGTFQSQFSAGFAVRTEDRDPDLIGKLNQQGHQQFCEDKPLLNPAARPGINCTSEGGNAAYLALPGLANHNMDNGDLNYDKGDIVNSLLRYAPRLQLTHEWFSVDLSAVAFYDPVNYDFTEYHPNNFEDNNGFQPRNTPRDKSARKEIGLGVKLLDAFVSTDLPLPGERQLSLRVGNQLLSLGTSTTLVFNGLNTVNPPDPNLRFMPGSDIRDVFRRVPLAVASSSITDELAVQGFYQLKQETVTLPPIGSYFSTNDFIGAGKGYVGVLFGKPREDPDNLIGVEERTNGNANILSNAGRTLYPGAPREARNSGQYGFDASYLASWLNDTTFSLTWLHLHSRLPTIGFVAAEEGCTNRSANQAEALVSCNGFALNPLGSEPLPIDSVKPTLEYVENINSYGFSFSTNLGVVAWTGEVVFRPDQPLQVDPTDVGFVALQPVFPTDTINFGVVEIPGDRVAIPDYLQTVYHGKGQVEPGSFVSGAERFRTMTYNTSFLALLGASDNPFGADQMTLLLEIGAYQVLDMPSLDRLQLATPGTQFHHSAGVDGTGTPTPQQTEAANDVRLNPSYQADGFATAFSWGYRSIGQVSYENLIRGWRVAPQFSFFHDVQGRAPLPSGEFFEGRKQATLGLSFLRDNRLGFATRYSWFFGGGTRNMLGDRDNLQFSMSYDF